VGRGLLGCLLARERMGCSQPSSAHSDSDCANRAENALISHSNKKGKAIA